VTLEPYLRLIAEAFVFASLALGYLVSAYWYLFCLRRLEAVPASSQQLAHDDNVSAKAGSQRFGQQRAC
jgi:hypothetical protein